MEMAVFDSKWRFSYLCHHIYNCVSWCIFERSITTLENMITSLFEKPLNFIADGQFSEITVLGNKAIPSVKNTCPFPQVGA